jgi:hypothetical protein
LKSKFEPIPKHKILPPDTEFQITNQVSAYENDPEPI